jgi:hypothetical protein
MAEEAWEKINVVQTWRDLKELGKKHGTRFFVVAVIWELIEDVLFPYLSWRAGVPELIPVFLVLHFEPVVYPVFFFAFRTYDRILGREPWEPDRLAQSALWRSGLQVLSHQLPAFAMLYVLLQHLDASMLVFAVFVTVMGLFGLVHDRLWHDSNFGIDVPTDTVQPIRVVAKVLSYQAVSAIVLVGLLYGLLGRVPSEMWAFQTCALTVHIAIAGWWAQSSWGIQPVQRPAESE